MSIRNDNRSAVLDAIRGLQQDGSPLRKQGWSAAQVAYVLAPAAEGECLCGRIDCELHDGSSMLSGSSPRMARAVA